MSQTLMYVFFRLPKEDNRPVAVSNATKVQVYPTGQLGVSIFAEREEFLYEPGEWSSLTMEPMREEARADVNLIVEEYGPIEKTGWQYGRKTPDA